MAVDARSAGYSEEALKGRGEEETSELFILIPPFLQRPAN